MSIEPNSTNVQNVAKPTANCVTTLEIRKCLVNDCWIITRSDGSSVYIFALESTSISVTFELLRQYNDKCIQPLKIADIS